MQSDILNLMKQRGYNPERAKPSLTWWSESKGLAPLVIIILIALAVGGYLLYQKQLKPAVPQPSVNPVASPVPTGAGETTNWETYTNEKCKFSLQYPEDWVVNAWPVEINSVPENVCSVNFGKFQLPVTREGDTELKRLGYLIEVWGEKGTDFEQNASENDIYKNRTNYKREKVAFNNLPAYRITGTGMDFPRDRLIVAKDAIVYSISVNYLLTENNQRDEAQKTFNQILSTFKFTQ